MKNDFFESFLIKDSSQIEYGEKKLKELAKELKTDENTTFNMLLNINKLNKFYSNWANASKFIMMKEYNLLPKKGN